ncbi:MAG TPA: phosphomannomutase/phosphoglucomutase [Candidatus Moranbacteria bacterium]|nr:phosphomannomutase/phosphoglucomutase [Candidatus Moranbacteria bacterium]
MREIFKAYDVRGRYPRQINEKVVRLVALAAAEELADGAVIIGRDNRPSSPSLREALTEGLLAAGREVIDLGVVSTPMLYFASRHLPDVAGAIMITASHNPPTDNGLKFTRADAVPIASGSGLEQIRDRTERLSLSQPSFDAKKGGCRREYDIKPEYFRFLSSFADLGKKRFSLTIDCANAVGALELPIFEENLRENLSVDRLYCDPTSTETPHEANPLKTSTLDDLRRRVLERKADLGVAYDGDADRVGFVNERGEVVSMDLIGALVARRILERNPGETVLYDLRSSMAVPETIEKSGGRAVECRVGHAFIKKQMRQEGAIFAAELSGHYYFRQNACAELPTAVVLSLLASMAESGRSLSELAAELPAYHHSGEINSAVSDPAAILARLSEIYADGHRSDLDGLKVSYWDRPPGERWWFSVRSSNTEPLLRLNLEADTPEMLAAKKEELLQVIRA